MTFTLRTRFRNQGKLKWHAEHGRKNYLVQCAQAIVTSPFSGVDYAEITDKEHNLVFKTERK